MLTRFKDRSRGSVVAAFDEARMLGHDSLGDEDLLLGILRAGEGIAAEALSSLGVTLEEAREESEGMLSDALSSIGVSLEELRREAGDTFDVRLPEDRKLPFSPRAKNALVRARKEMRRLGDGHLGTEHVLLGILDNEDGTAVRMLDRMGVSSEALEAACFVFGHWFAGRGERGWAVYSAISGLVFVIAFVLASAGFGQAAGLIDLAGLLQRVAVAVGFGWLTLLAVHLRRGPSPER